MPTVTYSGRTHLSFKSPLIRELMADWLGYEYLMSSLQGVQHCGYAASSEHPALPGMNIGYNGVEVDPIVASYTLTRPNDHRDSFQSVLGKAAVDTNAQGERLTQSLNQALDAAHASSHPRHDANVSNFPVIQPSCNYDPPEDTSADDVGSAIHLPHLMGTPFTAVTGPDMADYPAKAAANIFASERRDYIAAKSGAHHRFKRSTKYNKSCRDMDAAPVPYEAPPCLTKQDLISHPEIQHGRNYLEKTLRRTHRCGARRV